MFNSVLQPLGSTAYIPTAKLHLHARLKAVRIDILPFFFLKSRRSFTWHKIHVRFSLCHITRHAPKKSNHSSHSHGRDFNVMLVYNCNSQKSLMRWDCVPVILARSSRRKSSHRTGSLTRCKIVFAGFEFAKANCRKSTSNAQLVSFYIWNNHASEFWKENVWSQHEHKTK